MTKSQFNIKISKDLLTRVKRQATMLGKSLTEHITDLVSKSLSEDDIQKSDLVSSKKIIDFEQRLMNIESIVSNREYISDQLKPFTNSEALNCTKFMRGLFEQELKKRNYDNKNEAFKDLYEHIKNHEKLSNIFINRLEEILIRDIHTPWTGNELNELTGSRKCSCSIRKGLINWAGIIDFPSQQEICEKGEELLPLL